MPDANDYIPFARPSIGDEEIRAVVECLKSGWLTTGQVARSFEQEFAEFIGTRNAVAVNSATAGLHLALESLGLRAGQKVITTPYTFTASAEVIRYFDADPVFVDIDEASMNISVSGIREALSREDDESLLPTGKNPDSTAISAA